MDINTAVNNLKALLDDANPKDYIVKKDKLVVITNWFQRVIRWIQNLFIGAVDEKVRKIFNESIKAINPSFNTSIEKTQFTAPIITDALKKIKDSLFSSTQKQEILDLLECPVTFETLVSPLITPDGQTFSKSTIEELKRKSLEKGTELKNPISQNPMHESQLRPNKLAEEIVKACNTPFFLANAYPGDWKNDPILKLFLNTTTGNLIENPVVLPNGETDEASPANVGYPNRVVITILETRKKQLGIN